MQREMILLKELLHTMADISRQSDETLFSLSRLEKTSRVYQVAEVSFWPNHQ